METKLFEVRDRGTFIPVMATLMLPTESPGSEEGQSEFFLLRRAGYGFECPLVYVSRLEPQGHEQQSAYDCHDWGLFPRTMYLAHEWIEGHWNELKTGDVIDVEFINGETQTKKQSERPLRGPGPPI